MDLIRKLMLQFERDNSSIPDGYTKLEVAYNVNQMVKSGLIEAHLVSGCLPGTGRYRPLDFIFQDITPAGHDFIAHVRNDTIWNKVKDEMKRKAVSATVEIIIQVARVVALAHVSS